MIDTALLLVRLLLGLGMAAHGTQKLFGWFGGHGLAGTAGFFESLGFRPGRFFATAAALGETGGGLLVALGLFGPLGPALIALVMIVAILTVHAPNGFFGMNNGIELPLVYIAGAVLVAFTGPGSLSMDAAFGLEALSTGPNALVALAFAVVVALLNIVARGHKPATASSS